MDNNLFLTLMSNSSLNYYSENKTSGFTVHLPQKIQLTGNWVVALAELHYPYNFFNVTDGENIIWVEFDIENQQFKESFNKIEQREYSELKILSGFYKDIESILRAVNNELTRYTDCDVLSQNEMAGRTTVDIEKCLTAGIKAITFSPRLAMQLGFSPEDNILGFNHSNNVGNTYFGIPDQMLIYTDVIEPVFVGHEKAQVIKIVNTAGDSRSCVFGDVRTTEFQRMHYIPVMKKDFESISVDIRDCTGSYMPFRHGVSTVKLHFKKL